MMGFSFLRICKVSLEGEEQEARVHKDVSYRLESGGRFTLNATEDTMCFCLFFIVLSVTFPAVTVITEGIVDSVEMRPRPLHHTLV